MAKKRKRNTTKKKSSLTWKAMQYTGKGSWWLTKKIAQGTYTSVKAALNLLGTKSNDVVREYNRPLPLKNPSQYAEFIEEKSMQGSYANFEDYLLNSTSTIGLIIGARGKGKSAMGLKLLENVHAKTKRKVCTMGFRHAMLPSWMIPVQEVQSVPQGSFLLIDEGGITFSSRRSMSDANTILSELLLIARHKDLSILFISQNSSNLEVNALRQADYLLLKPSSLLQKDFERKKIKDIYSSVSTEFNQFKNKKGVTYVYSDSFTGFVSNPLPSFWSTSLSKSWKK
jgi:hypothetical protein